jgi:hypothetical protein
VRLFAQRAWYEVQVQVCGVGGFGTTYRGAMNGTLRECRKYAEGLSADGIGWRVVRTKVVVERAGSNGHDHLKHLFYVQAFRQAAQELGDMAERAEHDDLR